LILSGSTLYGTALYGGSSGYGVVFALNTDGTGFTNLHSFTSASDGANPYAGLVLSGNTLYGTAYVGGSSGYGTVFAVNTDGTGFTNLHNFTSVTDGGYPYAGLILSGNALYGTAVSGGSSDNGTVFKINTDGSGFTNLHDFASDSDGANPYAGLTLSDNVLYGATAYGGSSGAGTVFSLSLPVPPLVLTIIPSGTNVILTWPTIVAGYDFAGSGYTLQSTTNLDSSAVWATNSLTPVIVNGQYVVTNWIAGSRQFFRLAQQLP